MKNCKILLALCILFSVLGLSGIASAQNPDRLVGMEIETTSLSLKIGDTYTFDPIFETEVITGYTPIGLHIFSSNENVVKPGDTPNSITAVGGGKAVVYIFSVNYEFSATVAIEVSGAGKNLAAKGEAWNGPTAAQLQKVHDPALKAFYEMLGKPEMAANASHLAKVRTFTTLVSVTPGRSESLAEAIRKVGMDPVQEYSWADVICVTGTAEQYLILLRSDNILSVDENIRFSVSLDDSEHTMLEGQAENLSRFSLAHEAGLFGEGSTVAIFDTGIFPGHDQFKGKTGSGIIAQACFSTNDPSDPTDILTATCYNGKTEDTTSAALGDQVRTEFFTHGTHVTSIAAGVNGVAPKANIIAINVGSQNEYLCKDPSDNLTICYKPTIVWSDVSKAIDFLLEITDSDGDIWTSGGYSHVAAANFSLGSFTNSKKECPNFILSPKMSALLARNIIPVVASGNEHASGAVASPACVPSAFTVGALWDSGVPEVANYSNHSALVNILAPGTSIFAAATGTRMYTLKDGTSMASPMVTGALALLNGQYPELSAAELKTVLTGISTKTASRNKVSKPVLDFTNIQTFVDFMKNGPSVEVFGGKNSLQLNFSTIPFNTNYTIRVYYADDSDYTQRGAYIQTISKPNLKSATIKNLKNGEVYYLEITVSVTFVKGGEAHNIPVTLTAVGMPMEQGSGFAVKQTASEAITFSGPAGLYVEYGTEKNNLSKVLPNANNTPVAVTQGAMYYAKLYKTVTQGGVTFRSLPTEKQIFIVPDPELVDGGIGNGKIWLSFAQDPSVTGRTVYVFTQNASGALLKQVKKIPVDIKKNPQDIVITGLKNGTYYYVTVENISKIGKQTYHSFLVTTFNKLTPYTQPLKFDKATGKRELPNFENSISGVSATVGDRFVQIGFDKNLAIDGYRFEVKPIIPNSRKISLSVDISKASGSYKITGLTNGVLYKLRFQEFVKNGKKIAVSSFFPGDPSDLDSDLEEDNSWMGITFVPLAAPKVELSRSYYEDTDYLIITVDNVDYADGYVVSFSTYGNGSYTDDRVGANYPVTWKSGGKTSIQLKLIDDLNYTVSVQLYKLIEFPKLNTTQRYLGPAYTQSFIREGDDYVLYGPKSPFEMNLTELPEFADDPQVAGLVILDSFEMIGKGSDIFDRLPFTMIPAEEIPFEEDGEDDELIMLEAFGEGEVTVLDITGATADESEGTAMAEDTDLTAEAEEETAAPAAAADAPVDDSETELYEEFAAAEEIEDTGTEEEAEADAEAGDLSEIEAEIEQYDEIVFVEYDEETEGSDFGE